ncbi:SulP family inorganic anion transporter [Sunxiuqinia elliptica]|uniref:SulP family sulfate permease n=1 Tax=Sunxiuqinia elliptica TaxID=655355 RepID=A0A4R6HDC4_9BACT|nr:SulP family inorganic anion transporter [Sunxiuqinia elliptica]TDO05745.1 SulP family sulfate permease [Sunxiuqinia elliptica]TDO65287.1 SulP family sulfate permease [Sunxiuqinia elliptica]
MGHLFNPKLVSVLKQGYSKHQFSKDVFAGIIVGIVALPLAIAFAVASGVSPEKGLVTAVIAGLIISVLGGSRVQIGGPTGAFIVIVFGIVQTYGLDGLMISTMLAGVFLIAFGLLRLGSLLKFIPHPLVVGFTSGIALVIFTTQIKDALGLEIANLPADFIPKWGSYFSEISSINPYAVGISLATILITIFSGKVTKKIPGSFIAIIVITALVQLLKLPVTTIETVFGEIPKTIQVNFPGIEWSNLANYIAPALTIALLGGIESLLSAVVADGMIGGNHRSNTELIAQGVANVVTPIFGGIPATGAIARTATNVKNGGRTPVAGVIHAITLLLIMLFFGQWAKLIPMSCLAGILIVVAYNMSEWRSFVSILKGSGFDILILLVTFFLTVLVDLTYAIQIGIALSALLFMKRMADVSHQTEMEVDSDILENYNDLPEGVGIYEISGPFFFASAKQYCSTLKSIGQKSKVLIIRMRHVPFIDSTGLHNLEAVIEDLHHSKTTVILSGVRPEVMKELEKNKLVDLLDPNMILPSFDLAVQKAKEQLSKI